MWFVGVGCLAAAVHWSVAMALAQGAMMDPLLANVGGWLVALVVSFAGQSALTFRGHGAPLARAARRFALLSAGGFAINEAACALLLRWSAGSFGIVLAAVLLGVAAGTFVLSRSWAFR